MRIKVRRRGYKARTYQIDQSQDTSLRVQLRERERPSDDIDAPATDEGPTTDAASDRARDDAAADSEVGDLATAPTADASERPEL